jgi:hypothetical protein
VTQYQIKGSTRSSRKKVLFSFGRGGLRKFIYLVALSLTSSVFQTVAAADTDFSIGNKLADMLRASRNVISASQSLINDPDIGDKGFTGEKFVREVEDIYQARVGTSLLEDDISDRDRRLLEAQMQAMRRVIDRHQSDINRPDVGFKGFIPAIFARLANEEFRMIAGSEARIRVTAPSNLVRNRKARPDRWEKNILETKLMASDWPKGKPYIEVAELEGRPAFRMLLPEYYSESCLVCHGEPKGEKDITGYPMEGGKVGELGSVISIVIFR